MVSGTLYTYPGNYRAQKIQIAAAYSGADVKVASDFEFGQTNTSDAFLKKFPMGKVPAFEDTNGVCLTEPNAIAHYVSNETLRGTNPIDQALVLQYLEFADTEILPSACTWVYPTLGFKQYNKQDTEKAQAHLKKCLALLNSFLESRTFLVGERISLADIALACNMLMLYAQVLDPKFREPYGNVNRWFLTCINQPQFKAVLGDFALCEKMATFDNKRYQELHPKEKKGKDPKPKQEKKQKEEKPKEEKAVAPAEPPKPKKKDYFADVPETKFDMEAWKRYYSNNELAVWQVYLWENFDPNAWSFWHCQFKFNHEHKVGFMVDNSVSGMYHRLDGCRKQLFGVMLIFNEPNVQVFTEKEIQEAKDNNKELGEPQHGKFTVSGVFLQKGTTRTIFDVCEDLGCNNDALYYNWRKLDPLNSAVDKSCIHSYWDWEFISEYEEHKGSTIKEGFPFK